MHMHAPYDRLICDVTEGWPVRLGSCNHVLDAATNDSTPTCRAVDDRSYDGGVGTNRDRLIISDISQDPVRTSIHMHSLAQCISRRCLDNSRRSSRTEQSLVPKGCSHWQLIRRERLPDFVNRARPSNAIQIMDCLPSYRPAMLSINLCMPEFSLFQQKQMSRWQLSG